MGRKSPASRQRHRERKRAEYEAAMAPLRARGATCGTCIHYEKTPPGLSFKRHCDLMSDSGGYVKTEAAGLCPKWDARTGGKQ